MVKIITKTNLPLPECNRTRTGNIFNLIMRMAVAHAFAGKTVYHVMSESVYFIAIYNDWLFSVWDVTCGHEYRCKHRSHF